MTYMITRYVTYLALDIDMIHFLKICTVHKQIKIYLFAISIFHCVRVASPFFMAYILHMYKLKLFLIYGVIAQSTSTYETYNPEEFVENHII